MQFHIPSVEQAVPAVKAEPEPVVPVPEGVLADTVVEVERVEDSAATEDMGVTAGAAEDSVAKTPPIAVDDVVATEIAEVAEGAEPTPEAAAVTPVQLVGAANAVVAPLSLSTDSPGSGNSKSVLCSVPQVPPILATKISGRAL